MAQIIIIKQGDKDLKDVQKITPDTKIDAYIDISDSTDLFDGTPVNSMVLRAWAEDDVIFFSPNIVRKYDDESGSESSGGGGSANALMNENSVELADENGNVLEAS